MSKKTEEGGYGSGENNGWPGETPQEETTAAAEADAQEEGTAGADATAQATVPPLFLAIEEHAKALRIAAPVFAAVRQMKGWSEGKKVEATEFNEAVNAFLGAPIGGKQ